MKYDINNLITKSKILSKTNNYTSITVDNELNGILINNSMMTEEQNTIIKKLYDSTYFQMFNSLLWNPNKEYHINDECLCLFYVNNGFILKSIKCIKSDSGFDYTLEKPFTNKYTSNDTSGAISFTDQPILNSEYWSYNIASNLNIQEERFTFKNNKDLIIEVLDYKDKYYEDITTSMHIQRGNYSLYTNYTFNTNNNKINLLINDNQLNAPVYNINDDVLQYTSQLGMFFVLDEEECKLYLHIVYDNNEIKEALDNTTIIINSISNTIIQFTEKENITYSDNNKLLPIVAGCNNSLSTAGEIKIYQNKLSNNDAASKGLLLIDPEYVFNKDNIKYALHDKQLVDHDKKYLISTNEIDKDNTLQAEQYKQLDIKRKTSLTHWIGAFDWGYNYHNWGGIFRTFYNSAWRRDNRDYYREWGPRRRTVSFTNYYFRLFKKPRQINNFYKNGRDIKLYDDSLNCFYYIKLY